MPTPRPTVRSAADVGSRPWRDERGEVASWLILAAGLSAAAVLAVAALNGTIAELASEVGNGGGDRSAVTAVVGRGGDSAQDVTERRGPTTGRVPATGSVPAVVVDRPGPPTTTSDRNGSGRGGTGDGRGGPQAPPPQQIPGGNTVTANGVTFSVGPYAPPTIAHDNGFLQNRSDPSDPVPLPTRPPTQAEIDYYNDELRKISLADWVNELPFGRIDDRFNWDNAIPAYQHFLTGKGADRTFDMENYLTHDTNGGVVERALMADARAATSTAIGDLNSSGQLPVGQPVALTFTSAPIVTRPGDPVYPYPSSTDWQRTVGGMSMWTTTEVTATRQADGSVTVRQVTTIHGEDRYNFNPGQAAIDSGEPDSARGVLEESGLAHQYTQTGQTKRTTTWTVGP